MSLTSDDSISSAIALGTPHVSTLPTLLRSGVVGGPTDIQDYYRFVLAAPTDVRINMTGLSADIDFQLLDQIGRLIVAGTNGSNSNENALATGLTAGTYYVRTAAFGSASSSYDLSISVDPTSDDLLSNAFNLGTLSTTTPTVNRTNSVAVGTDLRDYCQFTLAAIADVRINLSGLASDADVTLEDSFGRSISSSAVGGLGIENLLASGLAAGTYFVRVNAFSGATNYLLSVSSATASDDLITNATALPALTSVTQPTIRFEGASAGGNDLQDYYKFTLNSAASIRLDLSGMSSDLDVEILSDAGVRIVGGSQSGNTIEHVISPSLAVGVYYVRVYHLTSAQTNYVLEITTDFNGDNVVRSGTPLGTLAASPLLASGSVGSSDIQDYYRITLTSTRNVRFLLTGLTADLDMQVLDSFGRLVGSGASGSTSAEDLTLNGLVAGEYYIRIFPFLSAISNYSLSVTGV